VFYSLGGQAIRNPFRFFSELLKQPRWVPVWVAILALANMASLFFWAAPLAKVIFLTFMGSAMAMMALYSYFGFEKILGIGHVLWLLLLPYILLQILDVDGTFFVYLVALSILLTVSLVFDVTDVWKYFHRKRPD
jgi:hypothetical protein